VLAVKKLEPLKLRKQWMHDLAQAVAFLESLNLAHGDLQPSNIFIHRDRVKLSDFDCTARAGGIFEAATPPYARLLNSSESYLGFEGSAGFLGPRTEQFALGSIYYFINYGFEVYGNRCFTEDPHDHGPVVVDRLQRMEFPELYSDDRWIDSIIDECWHYKFAKVADLAKATKEKLLPEEVVAENASVRLNGRNKEPNSPSTYLHQDYPLESPGSLTNGNELNGHNSVLDCPPASLHQDDPLDIAGNLDDSTKSMVVDVINAGTARLPTNLVGDDSKEAYKTERVFCQDLVSRGLVDRLSSKEPAELGFAWEWYRYETVKEECIDATPARADNQEQQHGHISK